MIPGATEISLIFSLTLVEMVELAVFVGAAVGIGSSLIIARAICKSNKALLEQQKKASKDMLNQHDMGNWEILQQQKKASQDMLNQQKIINSAKLVLHFLKYWEDEKHQGFQDFLIDLHKSKIRKGEPAIGSVLLIFEDIAILWREKTLTDNHVKEFFGNALRDIRDNEIMQKHIEKVSKPEPDFIYVNLRPLLEETRNWNI